MNFLVLLFFILFFLLLKSLIKKKIHESIKNINIPKNISNREISKNSKLIIARK